MPKRGEQVSRIATEQETMENISWAKSQAINASSPDGLTTLAKSFWHTMQKERK